jgi:hypothetical protein
VLRGALGKYKFGARADLLESWVLARSTQKNKARDPKQAVSFQWVPPGFKTYGGGGVPSDNTLPVRTVASTPVALAS